MAHADSDYQFFLAEVLAELRRRAATLLAEQAIEVRQRIEAAIVADLCHRLR